MRAKLVNPSRALLASGLFFQGVDGGAVHIVVQWLGERGTKIETACRRFFTVEYRRSKHAAPFTALPSPYSVPSRYRGCKACVAAIHRALEAFEHGEL